MLEEIVFTLGRIIVNLEGILQLFLQKKIIEAAAAARANKLQNQLQLFDRYWDCEEDAKIFKDIEEWSEIIWKSAITSRYVNLLCTKCIKMVISHKGISLMV